MWEPSEQPSDSDSGGDGDDQLLGQVCAWRTSLESRWQEMLIVERDRSDPSLFTGVLPSGEIDSVNLATSEFTLAEAELESPLIELRRYDFDTAATFEEGPLGRRPSQRGTFNEVSPPKIVPLTTGPSAASTRGTAGRGQRPLG